MIESKVILLTGASRGIGLAIAKFLLEQGHKVFLVARSEEPLRTLKEKFPGQVEFLAADLKDFEIGPKAVSSAISAFSRLDGLLLNHGTLDPVTKIADCNPEEWRACFDVNFFSIVAFIKHAIPHLRATKGRIVLTSSGAAASAYSTWGAYGTSKAALNHLAQTLAAEEPLITTLAIRPGVVDTDMQVQVRGHHELMDQKDVTKFRSLHEEGKLLRPEQPGAVMARVVVAGTELDGLSGRFLSWDSKELAEYRER